LKGPAGHKPFTPVGLFVCDGNTRKLCKGSS
jgi:hypothetical protein